MNQKEIVPTSSEYKSLPRKLGPDTQRVMDLLRIAEGVKREGIPMAKPTVRHVVGHWLRERKMVGSELSDSQVWSTEEGLVACAVNPQTSRGIAVGKDGIIWEGRIPRYGTHISPDGRLYSPIGRFFITRFIPLGCLSTIVLGGLLAWNAVSGHSTESSNRNNGVSVPDLRPTATVPALATETIKPVITNTAIPLKPTTIPIFTGSPTRTLAPVIPNPVQAEIKTKDCKPIIPGVIYECK